MQTIYVAATLLGAAGMWLLLPGRSQRERMLGVLVGMASLGLFASQVASLGGWGRDGLFWALAAVTLVSSVGTVTFRNPVYCAIWFALSLLGTASLLMFQGSQFLAVATVVVYAGAILVTFLFVLMLAQPKGQANYDRVSWEGMISATSGAVLVGVLTMTLAGLFHPPGEQPSPFAAANAAERQSQLQEKLLAPNHVALLGAQLFGRYLLAIEVAGTLLLVGLVGAVAIAAQHKPSSEASRELVSEIRPLGKSINPPVAAGHEKLSTRA